jgi:hypothetical protein
LSTIVLACTGEASLGADMGGSLRSYWFETTNLAANPRHVGEPSPHVLSSRDYRLGGTALARTELRSVE